jgi:hypothetical protein
MAFFTEGGGVHCSSHVFSDGEKPLFALFVHKGKGKGKGGGGCSRHKDAGICDARRKNRRHCWRKKTAKFDDLIIAEGEALSPR